MASHAGTGQGLLTYGAGHREDVPEPPVVELLRDQNARPGQSQFPVPCRTQDHMVYRKALSNARTGISASQLVADRVVPPPAISSEVSLSQEFVCAEPPSMFRVKGGVG